MFPQNDRQNYNETSRRFSCFGGPKFEVRRSKDNRFAVRAASETLFKELSLHCQVEFANKN